MKRSKKELTAEVARQGQLIENLQTKLKEEQERFDRLDTTGLELLKKLESVRSELSHKEQKLLHTEVALVEAENLISLLRENEKELSEAHVCKVGELNERLRVAGAQEDKLVEEVRLAKAETKGLTIARRAAFEAFVLSITAVVSAAGIGKGDTEKGKEE